MITDLHRAIMNKDSLTLGEANEVIEEMRQMVKDGADPEEVLFEEGLEPDYIFDLLIIN